MILLLLGCYASAMADVPEVRWDKLSLLIDGKRVCPVMGEIHYARATAATGPYLDKSGANVAEGSKGETLITPSGEYNVVENPMRAFMNSEFTHLYLCYTAIKGTMQTMPGGGFSTVVIDLPANWDALMEGLGYPALKEMCQ